MQFTLATLALAAVAVAAPAPQGVTSAISPQSSAPAGCQASYPGPFSIETVNVTTSSKRGLQARQASALTLTLSNGILKDDKGRTGYIAGDNSQLQFDNPPQTGAVYTAGFSVCGNGSLALGGTTIFQQCLQEATNGQGGYYDLYFESNAPQCSPIYIVAIGAGTASGAVSVKSDGQPTATPVPICQLSDGQPQVTSCQPVSQLSDGQVQATTAASAKVSQLSDGQVQATTAASAAPVSQLSDGQIQATTAAVAPVSQLSDGQVRATSAAAPVTQISDGQIQAPTSTKAQGTPVVQISDGQIRGGATTSATATRSSIAVYSGAALPTAAVGREVFGIAVGALAVALL